MGKPYRLCSIYSRESVSGKCYFAEVAKLPSFAVVLSDLTELGRQAFPINYEAPARGFVACLAAILVYTGCKLVNIKAMRELGKYGKGEVAVYIVTLAVIVMIDLLTGIVMGLGLAVVQLIYRFTNLTIRVERDAERNRTTMYLKGAATFLRLPKLAQALQTIPPNTELHVHFEDLGHIDHACLDLLMKWEKQHGDMS